MYTAVQHIHSYWAYLVLLLILVNVLNSLFGLIGKRNFSGKDFKISLFTLIATHIQLLLGIILFFLSPKVMWFNENVDVSAIMSNDQLRLFNVEHPLTMIIAVVLITIGHSRAKKKIVPSSQFTNLFVFDLIALILILAMIPWNIWL